MRYTIIEPGPIRITDLISLEWHEAVWPEDRKGGNPSSAPLLPSPGPSLYQLLHVVTPHFPNDYPERVAVNSYNGPADMFVGENSAVRGLEVNELATAVYWTASILYEIARRATTVNMQEWSKRALLIAIDRLKSDLFAPRIYGRAVLFSERVWF